MELYTQVTTTIVILVVELIAIVTLPHSRREGNGTIHPGNYYSSDSIRRAHSYSYAASQQKRGQWNYTPRYLTCDMYGNMTILVRQLMLRIRQSTTYH